jgi:hypothetical protein
MACELLAWLQILAFTGPARRRNQSGCRIGVLNPVAGLLAAYGNVPPKRAALIRSMLLSVPASVGWVGRQAPLGCPRGSENTGFDDAMSVKHGRLGTHTVASGRHVRPSELGPFRSDQARAWIWLPAVLTNTARWHDGAWQPAMNSGNCNCVVLERLIRRTPSGEVYHAGWSSRRRSSPALLSTCTDPAAIQEPAPGSPEAS